MSVDFFVGLKELCDREIEKQKPKSLQKVTEHIFTKLSYEEHNTQKLGVFGVADQESNDPQLFKEAFSILEEHKATISNRFHQEGYVFSFWIFQERIYRQKLKEK